MAKGELTILRCRAIAAELSSLIDPLTASVKVDAAENLITLTIPAGPKMENDPTRIVLRPISIAPVK